MLNKGIMNFTTLLCVIIFLLFVERSPVLAASEWLLMSRHGECVEVHSLKRKVPDLGDVRDPYAFIKLMRDKGHQVTVNDLPAPNGKAVEVTVPERELSLIFVAPEVCQQSGKEYGPARFFLSH